MLWKWLTSETTGFGWLLDRYTCFFLDEFAKAPAVNGQEAVLQPQMEEVAMVLSQLVKAYTRAERRLVVASAALDQSEIQACLGHDTGFLAVEGRRFGVQRFVAAPRMVSDILRACADLAVAALGRNDGNVLIFLPGLKELIATKALVHQRAVNATVPIDYRCEILHSDVLGEDETEQEQLPAADGRHPLLVLASSVAARAVTLPSMKYVFLHPYTRTSVLHASGLLDLVDEAVDPELEANMAGRVGRACEGVVTYLYDVDDSKLALRARGVEAVSRSAAGHGEGASSMEGFVSSAAGHGDALVTLVMAPPKRLYYARHTMLHLEGRGFPHLRWLRTPDATELASFDSEQKANRRVMILYYTTVLPTVRKLATEQGVRGVFLFEDTCILTQGAYFSHVLAEVESCSAGIFGYGNYEKRAARVDWHGTKGLFVTPAWCEALATIMENMHVKDFGHLDNWLSRRLRGGQEPLLKLLSPLAGYAHRASDTLSSTESRFGGAWLPPPLGECDIAPERMDDLCLDMSAPFVRDWVKRCRELVGDIRRGAKCPLRLDIPFADTKDYAEFGIYATKGECMELIIAVPLRIDMFAKPEWGCAKAWTVKYLQETWHVMLWRSSEAAKGLVPHSALRPDLTFLASLRYGAANATLTDRTSWLPMCPLLAALIERGIRREVGREAIILACMLEAEAATFVPFEVAAAWARAKTGDGAGGHVCGGLLIQLCYVLEDLEEFLRCVRVQMGTDAQKAGKLRNTTSWT